MKQLWYYYDRRKKYTNSFNSIKLLRFALCLGYTARGDTKFTNVPKPKIQPNMQDGMK